MPDLEARLNKLGFKEKSKRWQTAWSVKPVESDDEDGSEAPKRLPQGRQDDRQKKIEEDEDK